MANPSEDTAPTIDARLARHFLKRLRHAARTSAIEAALQAGLLYREHMDIDGHDIGVLKADAWLRGLSEANVRRVLRKGQVPEVWSDIATATDDGVIMLFKNDPPEPNPGRGAPPKGSGSIGMDTDADETNTIAALLGKIFTAAESLRAPEIATLLLLAQAVPKSDLTLQEVLAVLRLDQPIVAVRCAVAGFEEAFLDLLETGLVLPGRINLSDGYELGRRRFPGPRQPRTEQRWQVLHFTGSRYDDTEVDRQVGRAAQSPFPIVVVAESSDRLPARLIRAAQIYLDCGMLTAEVVAATIEAVLGRRPTGSLEAHRYPLLDLADLAIAIRPGVSPDQAMQILRDLAEGASGGASSEGIGGKLSKPSADAGRDSQKPARSSRRGGIIGSGSRIIAPAKLAGDPDRDRFVPRIETLSGYGEAATWAMALKDDIALWQEGRLAWADMTAKLLLSGPPGTGKTTFARALCNSLQVPLIATSVSTWLETGHLGDVLIRMNQAFAEAQAHRPAILFIDEIDGIGKRDRGRREYDDYWVSLVNKALELLDGALKSEGLVVVGATNYPASIDKALLRSGRLETHIEIPLPDTNSLAGIFRHHLKEDLDAVVASAPDEVKLGTNRLPTESGGPPPERHRDVQRNLPEDPR